MKTVLSMFVVALLWVPSVAAQARFHTGVFAWTPTVTLRDAGVDTNIYDEPTNPKQDNIAVVRPQLDGALQLGAGTVFVNGAAEFVYFHTYASERSINRRVSARLEVLLSRIRPIAGVEYLDTRERLNSEIDLRARRSDWGLTAGIGVQVSARGTIEGVVRASDSRYRQGEVFRGVDLPTRLDRDTRGAVLRFRYELTPLTTFTVDGDASRDRFVQSPAYDTDNLRANVGFEFSPDAMLKGRALVGYHRMDPKGALAFGYAGLAASVDVGYILLDRTRLNVRYGRDTTYSLEAQPYFLQTTYGGEVVHNLVGPLDVIGRAARERMAYPGIPDRLIEPYTLHVNRYGGGGAIRAGERLRISLEYEFTERLGVDRPDRSFDRRRLYTTISYGF